MKNKKVTTLDDIEKKKKAEKEFGIFKESLNADEIPEIEEDNYEEEIDEDYYGQGLKDNEDFLGSDTNIEDHIDEIKVFFNIPGINKDKIFMDIEEKSLEIKAEKKIKKQKSSDDFFISEEGYVGFYRKLNLPEKIQPKKAKAIYKNGILEIILPKAK
jgi:HSP20 family molecular chaperone IbpA